MAKLTKRFKEALSKIDKNKVYSIQEAVQLIKDTSKVKFDASVEVHVRLGIDPKKGDQIVRGLVTLPHGTGKTVTIAAFVPEDRFKEAKEAGADLVGGEELINEIKSTSKINFDLAVTTPEMMKSLSAIAKILGQKGLMPNPKTSTIGPDLKKMIGELKTGKVSFKNDNTSNVHMLIGKVSFDDNKLVENFTTFLSALKRTKPQTLKGNFIKALYLTSSMGPSVKVSMN